MTRDKRLARGNAAVSLLAPQTHLLHRTPRDDLAAPIQSVLTYAPSTATKEHTLSNVSLIRSNFALVVERAPDVVERFYGRLFTDYPALKPLFGRRSQKAQAEMLTQALVAVVEHLEDSAWLLSTLAPLGDKHRTYGVKDEMYPQVATALLATLREISSKDWNKETEAAWSEALGAVAKMMIGGTAAAGAKA